MASGMCRAEESVKNHAEPSSQIPNRSKVPLVAFLEISVDFWGSLGICEDALIRVSIDFAGFPNNKKYSST